ncbi:MAG: hypothetical protein WA869_23185, partial [Alloacidobacterium sp.]
RGAFGKDVRMDFEVTSGSRRSYVLILAAMNESSAHASANEIFRKWFDIIESGERTHRLVTIYNSASESVRTEDVKRLASYSNTVSYPEEQDFLVSILQGEQSQTVEVSV